MAWSLASRDGELHNQYRKKYEVKPLLIHPKTCSLHHFSMDPYADRLISHMHMPATRHRELRQFKLISATSFPYSLIFLRMTLNPKSLFIIFEIFLMNHLFIMNDCVLSFKVLGSHIHTTNPKVKNYFFFIWTKIGIRSPWNWEDWLEIGLFKAWCEKLICVDVVF
jgi:hypothetical protein